jgi:hypothetical protein
MKVIRALKTDLQNLRMQCGRDSNAVSAVIRHTFEEFGGWVSLASPLAQRDYEDAHTTSANLPKYKNISQQVLQSYISQATVKLLALQKRNAFLHNQVQVKRSQPLARACALLSCCFAAMSDLTLSISGLSRGNPGFLSDPACGCQQAACGNVPPHERH